MDMKEKMHSGDLYLSGDNTVIGAGSIVTKHIPGNVLAIGNPCKMLREINDHDKLYYFKDRKIINEDLIES
ncbi:serine acetyltransferase [Fontibacillus solani]|uniref:Acetyltransferase n=1 Tax=Fontibacillus solani TaxID=1572857 RepID=A0A7W3XU66_9BACL|nr:serine acetyltransferase [Fontibacillus solani]